MWTKDYYVSAVLVLIVFKPFYGILISTTVCFLQRLILNIDMNMMIILSELEIFSH